MALFTLDHGGGVMSTHEDGSSLPVDQSAPERVGPATVPADDLPALIGAIVALMNVQNVQILQIRSDGQIKGDDSPWHFPE